MTPEQRARVSIDALLVAAGWHVCGMADANIHAAQEGTAAFAINSAASHAHSTLATSFLGRMQQMPPLVEESLWPGQIFAIRKLEKSLKANKPRALIQMTIQSSFPAVIGVKHAATTRA